MNQFANPLVLMEFVDEYGPKNAEICYFASVPRMSETVWYNDNKYFVIEVIHYPSFAQDHGSAKIRLSQYKQRTGDY